MQLLGRIYFYTVKIHCFKLILPRRMTSVAPITLSSLSYLPPIRLASLLSEPSTASKIAVVDVRDSDHIGGNIKGSIWVPVDQLDVRMPELLRTLKDKERVVFHCMLSQQRGPKAALAYARAKQYADDKASSGRSEMDQKQVQQEICVLEGGFGSWQARYGEDERLTADYAPDIWRD